MCNCKKAKQSARVEVLLPGGLKITKPDEASAKAYISSHPGAKMVVKAA